MRNVSKVSAQVSKRSCIPRVLHRSMEVNLIPPNAAIVSSNNPGPSSSNNLRVNLPRNPPLMGTIGVSSASYTSPPGTVA